MFARDRRGNHIFTGICLLFNISSSLLIVFLNKWLYSVYGFPNIALTCIHFIVTSICLYVCQIFNVFMPKSLPIGGMLPLALTFCGFVVFTNLSLQNNTVGTYQLIKTMTTPCIIAIQTTFYKRSFSAKVKSTVIPIAVGVFLNSYYDLQFQLLGIVFASIGVVVTSLYQVWVGEKQTEYQLNSMQLLYYQAPLSATMLLPVVVLSTPFTTNTILQAWSPAVLALVLLSGLVAFAVNLSIYWIIGNTSPMTYNMVGHLKFSLTLLGGYFVFHESPNVLQVLGMAITICGVVIYSAFKMSERNLTTKLPTTSNSFKT